MTRIILLGLSILALPLYAEDSVLKLYRPLTDGTEQPALLIHAKKQGTCFEQSNLIKREDAWHCSVEGQSYDPCFVQPFGSQLQAVCIESPWSSQGIEIKVEKPLNNQSHDTLDMSKTWPWAIELSNGEKCQAVLSNESYDGLQVHYRCETQTTLVGDIQRCHGLWQVWQHAPEGLNVVDIRRAWF